jgi:hypothetical protein
MRRIIPHRIDITGPVAVFVNCQSIISITHCTSQEHNPTVAMEKRYICPRCNQEISSHDRSEHDDWHFAEDLERAEGAPSALPIRSAPPMSDRKHSSTSPTKSKPSWLQPVDSHHQSTMNSTPATNKHRHVPHVNAVDKAATLRAQSEVCISESSR